MTPLAQMIVNDGLLPRHKRLFEGEPPDMSDLHCFDVSDVYDLAYNLSKDVERIANVPLTSFLPAQRTWIEHAKAGTRFAFLLDESAPGRVTMSQYVYGGSDDYLGVFCEEEAFDLACGETADGRRWSSKPENWSSHFLVPAFLILINSPKVIGRRQHMPHRGLEKKLAAAHGVGKYPLHAWSEIKLQVFKPVEIDDGEPHEAHLTGRRALHFCRAHIRVRLGQLEFVSAHWRGDAAIGIKQTRYLVIQ